MRLTQKDIDEMKAELDHRKLELRPQLLEEVKETRAQGDLSENFEYHAAKQAKNRNESRIRYLEREIANAVLIPDAPAGTDVVGIGKTVTIWIPDDEEEDRYTFVSTIREDSLHGFISVDSPVGKALNGHKVGDTVTIHVNASYSYDVEIRKIEETGEGDQAKMHSF